MNYSKLVPSVVLALGLTSGIASATQQVPEIQTTGSSLFQMKDVSSQGLVANKDSKDADHKCGAGACGSAKHGEHKDGEHKCGSDKKDGEHGDKHDEHGADKGHHEEKKEHH